MACSAKISKGLIAGARITTPFPYKLDEKGVPSSTFNSSRIAFGRVTRPFASALRFSRQSFSSSPFVGNSHIHYIPILVSSGTFFTAHQLRNSGNHLRIYQYRSCKNRGTFCPFWLIKNIIQSSSACLLHK